MMLLDPPTGWRGMQNMHAYGGGAGWSRTQPLLLFQPANTSAPLCKLDNAYNYSSSYTVYLH